jgi:hypothetical protein
VGSLSLYALLAAMVAVGTLKQGVQYWTGKEAGRRGLNRSKCRLEVLVKDQARHESIRNQTSVTDSRHHVHWCQPIAAAGCCYCGRFAGNNILAPSKWDGVKGTVCCEFAGYYRAEAGLRIEE